MKNTKAYAVVDKETEEIYESDDICFTKAEANRVLKFYKKDPDNYEYKVIPIIIKKG